MNMAVPVSFFHRDLAVGGNFLAGAAAFWPPFEAAAEAVVAEVVGAAAVGTVGKVVAVGGGEVGPDGTVETTDVEGTTIVVLA